MTTRHHRRSLVAAWLVAALGSSTAFAQQPAGIPGWLRARLDGRLDARVRSDVERVVDSAYARGIPAEPLIDKALEGASKRGPSSDVIVPAVRALAVDLSRAGQVLGAKSVPGELLAGAAALRAGVDLKTLSKLRQDRPSQPLSVALGVLSDLIARGVPVSSATKSVLDLTKAGAADEQLVAFRRDVDHDVGLGASPAAAALLRKDALSLSLSSVGQPATVGADGRVIPVPKLRP